MFSASNAHACIVPAAPLPTARHEWNYIWSFRHRSNLASPTYLFSVFSDQISTAKNGRVCHTQISIRTQQGGNYSFGYSDSDSEIGFGLYGAAVATWSDR